MGLRARVRNKRQADAMLGSLFARIAPHLGLDAYFNYMVNEAGDGLQLESCAGIPEETTHGITRLEFGQAICGTVALRRQPLAATRSMCAGWEM